MDAHSEYKAEHLKAIAYIRTKVDQMLGLIGTAPLRHEELDDRTLLELDPIGIVTESFGQILAHLNDTNRELDLARKEIRAIFDAMNAAVMVLNAKGEITDCNRQAREWVFQNRPCSELMGRGIEAICPFGAEEHLSLLSGDCPEQELAFEGRQLQVIASDIRDDHERKIGKVVICFDITRSKSNEANLQLYAQVFGSTAEGIAVMDEQMRFVQVNEAFCKMTGYRADELIGRASKLLGAEETCDTACQSAILRDLMEHGQWQGEFVDCAREGCGAHLLQVISPVYDSKGQISHLIAIVTDITALKETQVRLDFLAHHDPLTRLPNRLLLMARLEHAIDLASRSGEILALLFIDLDHFKTINDSLGHQFGDRLLKRVASRLKRLVRRSDTIARLGGDEFVVLLEPVQCAEEATALAVKLISALRRPFVQDDKELHISCSVGITIFPDDGADAVTLLKNADAAMYQVKDSGRDDCLRFSPELSRAAYTRLTLETALRLAVRDSQLQLCYQPIINMDNGRVIAVETLARWHHAQHGTIPPGQFIPLAEETKLILSVGDWVMQQAIMQFARWRKSGLAPDYFSVNTSGIQLFSPGFTETLIGLLHTHQVPGPCLQVELTENVLMRDMDSCRKILERLRDEGIGIAIDDFGTGYSSLGYLKRLPIDDLKIDRSFVQDIPDDSNDCAIAEAIINMADSLGLETVAEGVETAEQEAFLTRVGCHKLQGYRYARPMTAKRFEAFQCDWTPPARASDGEIGTRDAPDAGERAIAAIPNGNPRSARKPSS